MLLEKWLPVPGYEDQYSVSTFGRVRGEDRPCDGRRGWVKGAIKTPRKNPRGYYIVALSRHSQKKTFRVHILVLTAFRGTRPKGYVANHKDGNPLNNRLENLEWTTQSQNVLHAIQQGRGQFGTQHYLSRLTEPDVKAIRHLRSIGVSGVDVARRFGVSPSVVCGIYKRRTYTRELEPKKL